MSNLVALSHLPDCPALTAESKIDRTECATFRFVASFAFYFRPSDQPYSFHLARCLVEGMFDLRDYVLPQSVLKVSGVRCRLSKSAKLSIECSDTA